MGMLKQFCVPHAGLPWLRGHRKNPRRWQGLFYTGLPCAGEHRPWWRCWCSCPSPPSVGYRRTWRWGSTTPRQDPSWPWWGQKEAGPESATPWLYWRFFFKLGETKSCARILQSPWVLTMASDAGHMGLINTSKKWFPLETLDCSMDKYSYSEVSAQNIILRNWNK